MQQVLKPRLDAGRVDGPHPIGRYLPNGPSSHQAQMAAMRRSRQPQFGPTSMAVAFLAVTAVLAHPVLANADMGNGTLSIEISENIDHTPLVLDIEAGEELMFYASYDDPDPFTTPTAGDFDFGDVTSASFGNVYEGCATPSVWALNEGVEATPSGLRPIAVDFLQPVAAVRHVYAEPGTYIVSARAFVERHSCEVFEYEAEWVEATLTVVVN